MSSSSALSSSDVAAASDEPRISSLIASAEHRSVELVSDLHLSALTPRTAEAFERYLASTTADMVVVLGDLFEVWIGDDIDDPTQTADATTRRVLDALHRSACQRVTALMVGNRDFLVGCSMLSRLGVIALADPTVLDAWGKNIVLSHGDALCLDDRDYQRFRSQVRAPTWQAAFLAKPRAERAALARAMRDASQAHQAKVTTYADADPAATLALLETMEADVLVHGHTHRPASHEPAVVGGSAVTARHVLSDWDLDAPSATARRADILRLTRTGFERVVPPGVSLA